MLLSKTINVSGLVWRYHVTGSSRLTLVVLPGSLGASEGTARMISENLQSIRVIVPEYSAAQTAEECMHALDGILEQEEVDRIVICGGSFGGVIAQSWARRHPDLVTHLILSGTGPPYPSRVPNHRRALRFLPLIPMFLVRMFLRFMLSILLRNATDPGWKAEYVQLIERFTRKDLASRYKVALDMDTNYKFKSTDLPASVKILLLEGERDRVSNKQIREQLRKLYPQAQTHTFHGAGHSPMITHTREWSKIVADFLNL